METEASSASAFAAADVVKCYQCGKCTAGCPVAEDMDIMPNRILLLVQTGDLSTALQSSAIWHCVSCQTCSTRCPQSVDIAAVMDILREMAARKGMAPRQLKRVLAFQRAFLDNIRRNGRIDEMELVAQFKTMAFLKDFNIPLLMKDALLGPKLLRRGKLHLRGEKVRDRAVVRRIFDRCMSDKGLSDAPHAAEAGKSAQGGR